MSLSASNSSYEPYAFAIPNSFAAASAFFKSREAIAAIALNALLCIPGITLRVAIDATPSTPHFTFFSFAIVRPQFLYRAAIFQRNYLTFAVSFVRLLPFLTVENSFMRRFSILMTRISFAFVALPFLTAQIATAQTPKFSVSFAKEKSATPLDGRLLLLLSTDPSGEPRNQISLSYKTQIVFGADVGNWQPGQQVLMIDGNAFGYPVRYLHELKPGKYFVQALLHRYETFHRADGHTVKLPMDRGEGQQWSRAPGNLYSTPQKIKVDPNASSTIK